MKMDKRKREDEFYLTSAAISIALCDFILKKTGWLVSSQICTEYVFCVHIYRTAKLS